MAYCTACLSSVLGCSCDCLATAQETDTEHNVQLELIAEHTHNGTAVLLLLLLLLLQTSHCAQSYLQVLHLQKFEHGCSDGVATSG